VAQASVEQLANQTPATLQSLKGSMTAGQQAALKKMGIDLATKPGLLGTLASNPLVPYAAMQLTGSMAQGHAQQQMVEDEREYGQQALNDDRERYNRNIGTRLYTSRYA
jgi:hypothetical protein